MFRKEVRQGAGSTFTRAVAPCCRSARPSPVGQEVDFETLVTMTEDDLKSIGLHLFGPRRKIATAIRKWHQANAARSNSSAGSAVSARASPPALVAHPLSVSLFRVALSPFVLSFSPRTPSGRQEAAPRRESRALPSLRRRRDDVRGHPLFPLFLLRGAPYRDARAGLGRFFLSNPSFQSTLQRRTAPQRAGPRYTFTRLFSMSP